MISENEFRLNSEDVLKFLASYQNNRRQEVSSFHTHYANQPAPSKNPEFRIRF